MSWRCLAIFQVVAISIKLFKSVLFTYMYVLRDEKCPVLDFKFGPELQSKGQKMKRHENKGGKRTPRLGKTET